MDIFSVADALKKRKKVLDEAASSGEVSKAQTKVAKPPDPDDATWDAQKKAWEKKTGRKWTD